ncbi:hypothetical protein KPH14_009331 [Odynerus spinipes]|uniref:Ropporin-1-like protein n=1 Tax=Odynerus spinipes TaxID=1348599 RepID=A0AAD9RPL0_9HYME|nr:hypothetical protein KPH14_009331 [Odynerus spinipes]
MASENPLANIYCPEQIHIPVTFPYILKIYAKAAIRTQPYDLLRWTAAYFRALANGEVPPVKERLEYPPFTHPSGITPGYLKTLLNRFGHVNKVPLRALLEHWHGIDLAETSLYQICLIGRFLEDDRNCNFYRFLAIACGLLANNLTETMIYACELLTNEPEGGSAMIPLGVFLDLYGFLADLDCSGRLPSKSEESIELDDLRPCDLLPCTSESPKSYDSLAMICHMESALEEEEEKSGESSTDACKVPKGRHVEDEELLDEKKSWVDWKEGDDRLDSDVKIASKAEVIEEEEEKKEKDEKVENEEKEVRKSDVKEKDKGRSLLGLAFLSETHQTRLTQTRRRGR